MMFLLRYAVGCVLACASLVAQTTWYVDASAAPGGNGSAAAPFVAIQAAIAAATHADMVLVAPGAYGPIDFAGKNIAVRSQVGATVTTLHGQNAGRVVGFTNGETAAAVLEGFTVTGGLGPAATGGGIHIDGASPTIRDCIISGNQGGPGAGAVPCGATGGPGAAGAIHVVSGSPSISGCRMLSNVGGNGGTGASGCESPLGGPVIPSGMGGRGGAGAIHVLAGSATLSGCRIETNTGGEGGFGGPAVNGGFGTVIPAGPRGPGGYGGLDASAPATAAVGFSSFLGNTGGFGAGQGSIPAGFISRGGAGAAGGTLFLRVCTIQANHGGLDGCGGIDVADGLVEGCLVSGNVAGVTSVLVGIFFGVAGGADVRRTPVVNSVIANNTGGLSGTRGTGGLRAESSRVLGCTITGNLRAAGANGAGGIHFTGTPAPLAGDTLVDTIVWGNAAGQVLAPAAFGTYASYCDVQGGLPGLGNIQADPLLADPANGDFHLLPGSPCIDAGNANVAGLPPVDVEGDPRVFHGAIDIGADESILLLRLTQPGGPGTPVTITNDNLDAGHEYYNVFSLELCTPPGSGPLLGLCATDIGFLASQFFLPLGAEPIHVLAPASLVHWGPYPVPPVTLEGICFEWLPTGFGAVSAVTRFTVQ